MVRAPVKFTRLHAFLWPIALCLALPVRADPPKATDVPLADDATPAESRITEIRVENNRRVENAAIVRALKQKVGMAFDPKKTSDDIKALWALRFFSDVQLLVQRTPTGIAYVVRVTEKPTIRGYELKGNKELSKDDFKDVVDLKPGTILDLAEVKKNVKKVLDKYIEKGYFLADVTYSLKPRPGGNEIEVIFEINEHAKVQVRTINLIGAKQVDAKTLRSAMQTQVGSYLSFLTSQGNFREEVFQQDLQILQIAYFDRGFVNVRVDKPIVTLSADKRFITISINIDEGEPFNVGKLDVSGDLVVPKEKILSTLASKTGQRFNRSLIARDIQAVTDTYYDNGYAYANISTLTNLNMENRSIDITLDAQKGEQVTVERINIVGNTKTRDKVIRRQLRVYEGDIFNGSLLKRSKAKVTALGFFETVEVTHKPGSDNRHVIVTVEVKEKSTGTFQIGLGFSNVESFIFTAQIAQQNFLGWGQSLSASAQLSGLRNFFQVNYIDPYFLDSNFIFTADVYRTQLSYIGFMRTSIGGTLGFGYYVIPDEMSLTVGYTYESVYVEPFSSASTIALYGQYRSGTTSGFRFTWSWDRRDNRLFPSKGFLAVASIETYPSFLGGTLNYNRYTAYFRKYFSLPFGAVFKFNIQGGQIQDLNPKNPLPGSELYYLGGITSIRGYTLRTISPSTLVGGVVSPEAGVTSFAIGGDKQFILNVELEIPILPKVGIKGVLFYDAGNVFPRGGSWFVPAPDEANKKLFLPLGLYHSVGFGIRWFSPIGPLRFEWGIPLTRRATDQPILFDFTIGNSF